MKIRYMKLLKSRPAKFLAALVTLFLLTSCSCLTPSQKEKAAQTGSFLLQKALQIALNTVVDRAQSPRDSEVKSDWLDSLAHGVRITDDDIRTLVGIWTPTKSHWSDLARALEHLETSTKDLPEAQRREIIAQALNLAAEQARKT